jgi:hypothetical protein
MSSERAYSIQQLSADDLPLMDALLSVFGEAVKDVRTYGARRLHFDIPVRPAEAHRLRLRVRLDATTCTTKQPDG